MCLSDQLYVRQQLKCTLTCVSFSSYCTVWECSKVKIPLLCSAPSPHIIEYRSSIRYLPTVRVVVTCPACSHCHRVSGYTSRNFAASRIHATLLFRFLWVLLMCTFFFLMSDVFGWGRVRIKKKMGVSTGLCGKCYLLAPRCGCVGG